MDIALDEALAAADLGEVPVGAVVVLDGKIVAQTGNRTRSLNDPTAHAETLAIRMACQELEQDRLEGCDLYVTLEPCTMCAGTISHARIRRVYFGAVDEKGGAIVSGVQFFNSPTCHHAPEVYAGIGEKRSAEILKRFFETKRVREA
ncbi:MAG: nucleoside deaminase [Pseudomonadota bacterium]